MATNIPTVDNGGVKMVGAGMDVTWNLKPGMKWSDGQPATSEDVRYTYQLELDGTKRPRVYPGSYIEYVQASGHEAPGVHT